MKDRLDKVLVDLELASSRSQASQLIKEGVVFYQGKCVSKPSTLVTSEEIEVRKDIQYVGRGAYKMEGAVKAFDLDPKGLVIADVGASTGGFTDYLLKSGAHKVYALDVGHDQLAASLRHDQRVVNIEGVNIRYGYDLPEKVDWVVADLSYISLKLTLEEMFKLAKSDGKIITLVKPQFEVGREGLDKGGIVKNKDLRQKVLFELYDWCLGKGFFLKNVAQSPIKGKTGNVEYLFYFDKTLKMPYFEREKLESII